MLNVLYVPGDGGRNAGCNVERRVIAEQCLRFADGGLRMPYVARSEVAVNRLFGVANAVRLQGITQCVEQIVQAGSATDGDVIDLIARLLAFSHCRQQVGLDGVIDVAKIAAGLAIAINENVFSANHCGRPFRHDRGVRTSRVLPSAEDVEVTQADGGETVAAREDVGVQLVYIFGDRVGRERLADGVFDLWQPGVVAVGGTAGGIGKAAHLGVAGGDKHVQEAVDICGIGGNRVVEAARHGSECGLMQNVVHAGTGGLAILQPTNVAFDEPEACPLGW